MKFLYLSIPFLLISNECISMEDDLNKEKILFNKGRIYQYIKNLEKPAASSKDLYKSEIKEDGTLLFKTVQKHEGIFDKNYEIIRYHKSSEH